MKDVVVLGTGGFAREVLWILEENNRIKEQWNIMGFIDKDGKEECHGYPVLGADEWLVNYHKDINVICGVGSVVLKRKLVSKFAANSNIHFPSIIANGVKGDFNNIKMGQGCIICEGTILTTDIVLGNFVTVNLSCTIGHDAVIKDYVTVNPGSNISGNVNIKSNVEIGTGVQIIQGMNIGENVVIGAGAVVVDDIPDNVTAVGIPARPIKKRKEI